MNIQFYLIVKTILLSIEDFWGFKIFSVTQKNEIYH